MKDVIILNETPSGKSGSQNNNPVIILDKEEFGIGITSGSPGAPGAPGQSEGPGNPPPCCCWGGGAGAMEEDIIL